MAGTLAQPKFTRSDAGAGALVLLVVTLVVGLPFAHVGEDLPEGRAYRAYFTADFVWELAVVAELAKGDMPPRNPYYLNDDLHYYWLMHLLPAAEHRSLGGTPTADQLLLVNAFWSALAFAAFWYFFVRHFVSNPWAAAIGCVFVLLGTSLSAALLLGNPFGAKPAQPLVRPELAPREPAIMRSCLPVPTLEYACSAPLTPSGFVSSSRPSQPRRQWHRPARPRAPLLVSRSLVAVLGMHRSGTSATMGTIERYGIEGGPVS